MTRSVTLDLISAASKALTRRSIATKVLYLGTTESDIVFSDCEQPTYLQGRFASNNPSRT